ncbi:Transposase, partial [Marininema mesophilum]
WYCPLKVDSEKSPSVKMDKNHCLLEGDFLMAKKGQKFHRYSPETKTKAVRLRMEKGLSYRAIQERLGIQSKTQVVQWVKQFERGESFEDHRGGWNRKHFTSLEEENAYLKAQVDFLKKRYPNLLKEE